MKFKIKIKVRTNVSEPLSRSKRGIKKPLEKIDSLKLEAGNHHLEIELSNIQRLAKILSPEKLRLIMTVRDKKPQSLYELSQLLGRDPGNVFRNVKELENVGVLKLTRTFRREGLEQDVMVAECPWDGFEIELP